MSFSVKFDENNQQLILVGALVPQRADELQAFAELFERSLARIEGTLYINVKRLVRLNNTAFHELARLLATACERREKLLIKVVTTSVIGWASRKLSLLSRISPRVTVEEYDRDFYPGQDTLEYGGFIPILRTQTKMTWRHEEAILARHGLQEGMAVADVCCGIGDFAALLFKRFNPSRLVAVDHAKSSLDYARRVADEFGLRGIEYVFGDATSLLFEDNEFDFVTCRHSLQVFDEPSLILNELFRICKPGGRVYISNEKNSHCLGEPRADTIQWTYNEVARLWAHFKMDIELGPKSRRFMVDAGFTDVRMESFMCTNLDGDAQDFADVIQAWEDVYAGKMAVERGDSAEFIARFRQGFADHRFAALHPKGYAGWPIWVASGRKP